MYSKHIQDILRDKRRDLQETISSVTREHRKYVIKELKVE
jgi:hypothetical protein